MTSIRLVEHDPAWAAEFEAEAARIRAALGAAVEALHHIGSTAVPGIVAKPVIDMLAVATSVGALDLHAYRLEPLGYESLGEFGIPGRRYFRKDAADGTRTHHLHAFPVGSADISRHVDFRDYLRAHPAEARAYAELKLVLAGRSVNSRAYTEGKTDYIRDIERRATDWRHQSP